MTSVPDVSVVIPTRNRWQLLSRHALPSALAQVDVELEVVVVDDASEDETSARLSQLEDPRVRVVAHEARRGLAAARNSGAAVARGTWLSFLDDDDLWAPDKLRVQIDAATALGRDWAYARAIVVDSELRVIADHPFPQPEDVEALLHGGNHVPGGGSNVIVLAETHRQVGGFDEELRYFEDWDFWLRLVTRGIPAACPEVVVARVEHGQNMLFRDRANVLVDFERLLSKHRGVTQADRLAVAEWLAHEHVRAGMHRRAAVLYLRAASHYRSPGNLVAAGGALFGRRGVAAASRLLMAVRGRTHLREATNGAAPPAPAWLNLYVRSQTARKL